MVLQPMEPVEPRMVMRRGGAEISGEKAIMMQSFPPS